MDNIVTEVVGDFVIARGDGIEVALCTKLDESLIKEGYARDLASKIQQFRKSLKLNVSDRILLYMVLDDYMHEVIRDWGEYIFERTLSIPTSIDSDRVVKKNVKLDDHNIVIGIEVI